MHFQRFRTCSHVADRGYTCHEFSLASGDFGPRTGSVVVLNTSCSMIAIHQSLVCGLAHVFRETETPLSFFFSRSAGTLTETDGKTSRSTGTVFWWFAFFTAALFSLIFMQRLTHSFATARHICRGLTWFFEPDD